MKFEMVKCTAPVSILALMSACGSVAPEEQASTTSEPLYSTNWSGTLPQYATDVAVASRGTNLLDQFSVDNTSDLVYSRYAPGWQPDISLGAPSGTTLSHVAAVNNGGRVDVFVVGSDNHIWHRHTNVTTGAPTFSAWANDVPGNPSVAPGSPIAVTSWGAGRLDLFWWTPRFNFGHAWADSNVFGATEGGDTPSLVYLQPLEAVPFTRDLTAVSWGPGRIDFFAGATQDNDLEHHWYDANYSFWGAPGAEHREVLRTDSSLTEFPVLRNISVTATTRGSDNIEFFITAQNGSAPGRDVYHVAYNSGWTTFNPGGVGAVLDFDVVSHSATAAPTQVNSALVWSDGSTRLDLFGSNNGAQAWQAFSY